MTEQQQQQQQQEHLSILYKDATHCIPVLLEDREGLPINEIYAPLLIEEDLEAMKRTRRPDEPGGRKTLKNLHGMFRAEDKLSTRIFIKGEAGSGKSVFCLKIVESWSQLKQSSKHEHVCEKESDLITQLKKDGELPRLLQGLRFQRTAMPCTTCELQQCLSEFDFLYYVPLRDTIEGKTSVVDLVCDAVCNGQQVLIDRTKQVLSDDNVRCLIILDGLDEWPTPAGFSGLPSTFGLSMKCVLLSTMRPWKLVNLRLAPKENDRIINICGLSSYSVSKVIENILLRFYGIKGEKLKLQFLEYCEKVKDKTLEGLMRMPMMLVAACHLWYEGRDQSLGVGEHFSRTQLYLSLLEQMIKSAANKQSKQQLAKPNAVATFLHDKVANPSFPVYIPKSLTTFHHISHFIEMLLPFCELAYNDLVSSETKLVFHKGQLERRLGESQVDLAFKLGLISQVKIRGSLGSPQHVNVSFYHKSVQELLAAVYLTTVGKDAVTSFCEVCSTLENVMEMDNVIMFVMGLDPTLGSRLSIHIASIVDSDKQICKYRQTLDSEDLVKQLYQTQCRWYRELKHNQTLTGDKSSSLTLQISDIYLDSDIDKNTVILTDELVCRNLDSIVSLWLRNVKYPLDKILSHLVQCPLLRALGIYMILDMTNRNSLVAMIPRLTQLDTLYYNGRYRTNDVEIVKSITQLKQLKRIEFKDIPLGDEGMMVVTSKMTRLQTVILKDVYMSAMDWDKFITTLLGIQNAIHVTLNDDDIDRDTVRRVQTSPCITLTHDDRGKYDDGRYKLLDFTTIPSLAGDGTF